MTKEISKVIEKINEKPYVMAMGAGKISKWLGVSKEDVKEAKRILYEEGFGEKVREINEAPRILLLDIETAPLLAYVFRTWKTFISHDNIISDWFILAFSCKYLGDDTMISYRLTSEEAINQDDSRLIGKLWGILYAADIVICHNGDFFDIPKINTRFVLNGLGPTTYYKQIDTLKIAKHQFSFTHNSLGALADFFGIPHKIETGFNLWKRCYRGDETALIELENYNRHDVEILEQIYLKLRPWIKSHPNLALYDDIAETSCPHCNSKNIQPDGGFYVTQTGKYPTFKCLECGAELRGRKSVLSKDKSRSLIVSIPGR